MAVVEAGQAVQERPDAASWTVVRGDLVHIKAADFDSNPMRALTYEPDGLLICRDGVICAAGAYGELRDQVPADVEIVDHRGRLICPGFVDCHVHYAQTAMFGSSGRQLLDWLDASVFPAEAAFADPVHARTAAEVFCDELLRNGTTTALVFCSVHPSSVDAIFAAAETRGMQLIAGKTLMDRNAPEAICDTPQSAYDDSRRLIERWHGRGRALYAVTPRFAITSTPAQFEVAGALRCETPGVYVHTHVSENRQEVAVVGRLYAERSDYLDVYDHYGLVGGRTVLAHGVYLGERELRCCHDHGAALAHCPTSNLFLGSGLFSMAAARDPRRPVKVGLGSDIGAGTSFSILATAAEAYKVAQLQGNVLSVTERLYLATLGGARALGLGDRIGSLEPGKEADFVVLDPTATPLLSYRLAASDSIEDLLSVLMSFGDDRMVSATYTRGKRQS